MVDQDEQHQEIGPFPSLSERNKFLDSLRDTHVIVGGSNILDKGPFFVRVQGNKAGPFSQSGWNEHDIISPEEFLDKKAPRTLDKSECFDRAQEIADSVIATMRKKNADYTGTGNFFANFERSESIGIPRLTSLYLRMLDKGARVESFLSKGKLEVENEGLEDAFKDLIGYSLIALLMIEDDKRRT